MCCWMVLNRGDEAGKTALRNCQQNEQTSGGHSWGVAVAHDGELTVQKGVGNIREEDIDIAPEGEVALGHTRFATRGDITLENAHPFEIRNHAGETIAVLAHNGTWYGAPDDGRCDSYHIARVLESLYRSHEGVEANEWPGFEALIDRTREITGETITVLHRDGRAWAGAGRFGITHAADAMDADVKIMSTGGTPIPSGSVKAL